MEVKKTTTDLFSMVSIDISGTNAKCIIHSPRDALSTYHSHRLSIFRLTFYLAPWLRVFCCFLSDFRLTSSFSC
jgi:hypothetical protein